MVSSIFLPITGIILLLTADTVISLSRGCGSGEREKCVRMADPLITDAHMIFPDNMVDMDAVCRKWTQFVGCIKDYTDSCLTQNQKQQFNNAVEKSVESIHQMCTSTAYQSEYLKHATCLKNTLTDDRYCGRHYKYLASQVQGNRDMERDDLCCSHHRFRECVLSETRRSCDKNSAVSSQMLPSAFSKQILDKALNFLREQCSEYIPSPGECIGYQSSTSTRIDQSADELTDTTRVIGPTYNTGQTQTIHDVPRSTKQETEPETPATLNPLTWIPSRDGRRRTTDVEAETTSNEPATRSSYGRGVTWEPTLGRDDIFKATHYKPSTEPWYPGNNINYNKDVDNFNGNDVEEPNQQGLAHFDADNSATSATVSIAIVCVQIIILRVVF